MLPTYYILFIYLAFILIYICLDIIYCFFYILHLQPYILPLRYIHAFSFLRVLILYNQYIDCYNMVFIIFVFQYFSTNMFTYLSSGLAFNIYLPHLLIYHTFIWKCFTALLYAYFYLFKLLHRCIAHATYCCTTLRLTMCYG